MSDATCTTHCWHPLSDSCFPVPRTDERCCRCGLVEDYSRWPGVSWSFTPEHYAALEGWTYDAPTPRNAPLPLSPSTPEEPT